MKKITSIALVLIMSLQCFYNLGVITYFHLNRDYIAEVLCINKEEPITMCHGQCFLDKNLDIADATPASNTTRPAGSQAIDFPLFLISESYFAFCPELSLVHESFIFQTGDYAKHLASPFHPPKSLS